MVKNFQTYPIFNQKIAFKIFEEVKIVKLPAGFVLMTNRFVVNAITHCATLFGKETTYIIMIGFIVYFDNPYVTTWKCPTPP